MEKVVYKELSYKLIGLMFEAHKELGRFRNEKQYADYFEFLLKREKIDYKREHNFRDINHNEQADRCICDFIIDDKIILEFKARKYITKDDYFQTKRYLTTLNLRLAIITNFREERLYPKRVLNGIS